ncbi:MAG: alpha-hydroxy-acid oxidizing protein, partial [Candidatus Adiutrix sp.]|nr:alpha-hydroxy-acid oxidizing protein [Candidatus Adiutrix sp.]
MDIKEIRNRAREAARGSCRVCAVCDGTACAGEVPGMGGAGAGLSFRRNVEALAALRLKTRLVHQVRHPEMSVEILGLTLSLPLLIAPIGGLAFNLGGALSEADYQEAVVAGATRAGILAGTPDGAPPEVMETGLACARRHGGRALAFIKPWAVSEIIQKMEMAAEAGCRVVACDLDSIGLITLRQMGRPAYAKDARELAEIAGAAHRLGLKFVLKGLMSREDALAGLEAGVDGLVVSNHGGRVLDGTPGTAEVL